MKEWMIEWLLNYDLFITSEWYEVMGRSFAND